MEIFGLRLRAMLGSEDWDVSFDPDNDGPDPDHGHDTED